MDNEHYLARNSEQIVAWIDWHHGELGHAVETIKDAGGFGIGYKDLVTNETIYMEWRQ